MKLDEQLIRDWVARGVVTQEQSQQMLAELAAARKEHGSNRLIVALSTLGALLLGVGAVLFIASNWQEMSRVLKQFILIGSTFGTLAGGYYLQYVRGSLPKVGAALLFLSALLFGATLALLGQMYNVPANAPGLLLVWLIGVAPLAYLLRTAPLTALTALLLIGWTELYVFNFRDFFRMPDDMILFPVFTLMLSGALFALGGAHYLVPYLKPLARIYRLIGLQLALAMLFVLSFADMVEEIVDVTTISLRLQAGLVVVALVAISLGALRWLLLKDRSRFDGIEFWALVAGVGLALAAMLATEATAEIFAIVFNFGLIGGALLLLWMGYEQEDLRLVNMGMGWLALLIVVRYFDFFWDLLPRSLFFLVGGALLIGGGTWLERKRRGLKQQFADTPNA